MAGFKNIDEELTWEMFKMSDGNPYIAQDLVQLRNKERTNTGERALS